MADRKNEMDAVRTAEFKEAFDEFDKVSDEDLTATDHQEHVLGPQRCNLH